METISSDWGSYGLRQSWAVFQYLETICPLVFHLSASEKISRLGSSLFKPFRLCTLEAYMLPRLLRQYNGGNIRASTISLFGRLFKFGIYISFARRSSRDFFRLLTCYDWDLDTRIKLPYCNWQRTIVVNSPWSMCRLIDACNKPKYF